ncbi:MAG TPA: hypothetical protein VFV87_20115 [Pirellulaceae bacterium]|nr:hypothetical protein [Pirellulaceae bacterium]
MRKSSGLTVVVVAAILLLMLAPLLYVAAIGPVVWLADRGMIDVDEHSIAAKVYAPLEWSANECEPVAGALEWYVQLWSAPPASPPAEQYHSY